MTESYRPGVAQRVGRGIALLFHDRCTRRGWAVSSTLRPHFTPGKEPVPILQEAAWAPGPVWTGGKSRPHRDSIPDRPVHSSVAIPTELPGPQMTGSTKRNLFIYVSKVYLSLQLVRILFTSDKKAENTDKISFVTTSKVRFSRNRFSWNYR